jgi:hypothetical protein
MAILYWQNLSKVFNKLYPEFRFTDRNGRKYSWNMNASDEINALLGRLPGLGPGDPCSNHGLPEFGMGFGISHSRC